MNPRTKVGLENMEGLRSTPFSASDLVPEREERGERGKRERERLEGKGEIPKRMIFCFNPLVAKLIVQG